MQGVGVVPVERLCGSGMISAEGTAETFGPDAYVHDPPQDGQMAQHAWLVYTVALGDDASTAAAVRASERALDGEDQLACFGQFGL